MNNASPTQIDALHQRALMQDGIHQILDIMPQTVTNLSAPLRFKLVNSGYTVQLRVFFTLNFTSAGVLPVLSKNGIQNLFQRIEVIDYDGKSRISAHPLFIWMCNNLRQRRITGMSNVVGENFNAAASILSGTWGSMPNATLVATGANTVNGYYDIPICVDYDDGDLDGLLATNQNAGECSLVLTPKSSLGIGNDDSYMFNSNQSGATGISLTVWVKQYVIMAQPSAMLKGLIPMPRLALSKIHEIISGTTSDNLVAAADKQIALPYNRHIMRMLYQYLHNGVQGGSTTANDLAQHSIVAGGSLIYHKFNRLEKYIQQREEIGVDMSAGLYFWDFMGIKGSGKDYMYTDNVGGINLVVQPGSAPVGTTQINFAAESLVLATVGDLGGIGGV